VGVNQRNGGTGKIKKAAALAMTVSDDLRVHFTNTESLVDTRG